MLLPGGKMEQPLFIALTMADVITMWQDGTVTFYNIRRQMLLPGGRWNSCYVYCEKMAGVIAKWQMELPLRVGDVAW